MTNSQYTGANGQLVDLDAALTPEVYFNDGGAIECLQHRATHTAECFGRLLAALVEKNVFTLDEAGEIADVWPLVLTDERDGPPMGR